MTSRRERNLARKQRRIEFRLLVSTAYMLGGLEGAQFLVDAEQRAVRCPKCDGRPHYRIGFSGGPCICDNRGTLKPAPRGSPKLRVLDLVVDGLVMSGIKRRNP